MHYQNPGQRPQVKLLCGLLMFLTVRAIPEEGVTKKEITTLKEKLLAFH